MNLKTKVALDKMLVLIVCEFQYNSTDGVYCTLWQVFDITGKTGLIDHKKLRDLDLALLPHDELSMVAEAIDDLVEAGKTKYYSAFEEQYISSKQNKYWD